MFLPLFCLVLVLGSAFGNEDVSTDQSGPRTINSHFCTEGYYKSGTGKCTECSPGRFSYGGERTSCRYCPMNTYNPRYRGRGPNACLSCPNGKSSLSGSAICRTPGCSEGSYGPSPTSCTRCEKGKYNDQYGVKTESGCKDCPVGKTTYGTGSRAENACTKTQCPPGKSGYAGTERCKWCEKGKFSSKHGSTYCTKCPEGKTTSREGRTGESDCENMCGAGEYGVHSCQKCPTGRYFSGRGAKRMEECHQCPSGKSTKKEGSKAEHECEGCPRGKYGIAPNCQKCEEGKYSSKLGSERCFSCETGYVPNMLKTACEKLKCDAGQEAGADGKCSDCREGFHRGDQSSHCLPCHKGQYSRRKAFQCTSCEPGKFQSVEGQGKCEHCPAGTKSKLGAKLCERCNKGEYSIEGAAACLKCPAGTYSSEEGSEECFLCEGSKILGAKNCSDEGHIRDRTRSPSAPRTLPPHSGRWPDDPGHHHDPDHPRESDDEPGSAPSSTTEAPTAVPTLLPGSGEGDPNSKNVESGNDGEAGVIAAAVLVPSFFCCGFGAFLIFFFFMRKKANKDGDEALTPYETWMKVKEGGVANISGTASTSTSHIQPEVESTHNPMVHPSAPPVVVDPILERAQQQQQQQEEEEAVDMEKGQPVEETEAVTRDTEAGMQDCYPQERVSEVVNPMREAGESDL